MTTLYKSFVQTLASLKLTVLLLVLSMLLVFFATLDQVNLGIWAVQQKYFRSLFVLVLFPGTNVPIPAFPGGYLIGPLMFLNLTAAFLTRLRLSWKKAGLWVSHLGLILLLVGELLSGLWQEDYQMNLNEGETKSYAESFRDMELAILNTTSPDFDEVVAIPANRLGSDQTFQHPKLPFRVVCKAYFPNSTLAMKSGEMPALFSATQGIGTQINAIPLAVTYKENEVNMPTAFVEIIGEKDSLGTWLVSPQLGAPQTFDYAGKSWRLNLRSTRRYSPFSLTLLKVTHETYQGSEIPKNFASRVRIKSDDAHDNREVQIYMNNPLRYGGLTFYQYQMNAANHNSVFQVVRNPSWLIPYIACFMMAFGLLYQFTASLLTFANRRTSKP